MVHVPEEACSAALTVCLNTGITLVTVTQATNKGFLIGNRAPLQCVKGTWSNLVFQREGDGEAEGGWMKDTWQQKTKTDGPDDCVWEL